MSFRNFEYWENGDYVEKLSAYTCDCCLEYIAPNWYRVDSGGCDYCPDCAFKKDLIGESEYLPTVVTAWWREYRAKVYNNKIFVWKKNRKCPLDRKPADQRNTKEYSEWRSSVFERDNFTCVDCKKRGGYIEAHHIKKFKDFAELRFDVDNGKTLCKPCHVNVHRSNK